MTKQQTIDTLKSQIPSFYSLEQVITLIEGIEESTTVPLGFTDEQRGELVNTIAEEIAGMGMDIVSDYDLSMSYNEVEIDDIDFDTHSIKNVIENVLDNWIDENWNKKDDCDC
jgi:prefoldin subunit 5